MDNILIILSLVYDGSKVYVNPKNICAIYRNSNGNTELLFAGGDGSNYVTVKESTETVAKMIGRAWGGPGRIEQLPSAQPEITDEQAIDCLQESGWMQNHDKQMYEMGLREQLADDSGSYAALLPSAQPEIIRCKDCRYGVNFYRDGECYCSNPKYELRYFGGSWEFYCTDAERRTDG